MFFKKTKIYFVAGIVLLLFIFSFYLYKYFLVKKSTDDFIGKNENNLVEEQFKKNISDKYVVDLKSSDGYSTSILTIKDTYGNEVHKFSGLEAMASVYGVTKDNSFFYKCRTDGFAYPFLDIYSLPDMSQIFRYSFDKDNLLLVECGSYDDEENSIGFYVSDDWDSERTHYKYYFDTKKLLTEE